MLTEMSPTTVKVYIRRIKKFENVTGITKENMLNMDADDIYDLKKWFISEMQKKGHAPSYTHSVLKAVKSWLKYNRISVDKVKVKNSGSTPTLRDEKVPDPEIVDKIIETGWDDRTRIMTALMAYAGLRPESIGNHNGSDGLIVDDVQGDKIRIRETISKNGREYFVIITEKLRTDIERYVKKEGLTGSDPLIYSQVTKKHCTTKNIRSLIRKVIRKAGYDYRPYLLRRWYSTQMMNGEYDNIMPHGFSQFLMGHSGDMMSNYTMNKGLPTDLIEKMRRAYHDVFENRGEVQQELYRVKSKTYDMEKELDRLKNENLQLKSLLTLQQESMEEKYQQMEKRMNEFMGREEPRSKKDMIAAEIRRVDDTVPSLKIAKKIIKKYDRYNGDFTDPSDIPVVNAVTNRALRDFGVDTEKRKEILKKIMDILRD